MCIASFRKANENKKSKKQFIKIKVIYSNTSELLKFTVLNFYCISSRVDIISSLA